MNGGPSSGNRCLSFGLANVKGHSHIQPPYNSEKMDNPLLEPMKPDSEMSCPPQCHKHFTAAPLSVLHNTWYWLPTVSGSSVVHISVNLTASFSTPTPARSAVREVVGDRKIQDCEEKTIYEWTMPMKEKIELIVKMQQKQKDRKRGRRGGTKDGYDKMHLIDNPQVDGNCL